MDNIAPEALKFIINVLVPSLAHHLNRIWNKECIPLDWNKGLLVKLPKLRHFLVLELNRTVINPKFSAVQHHTVEK